MALANCPSCFQTYFTSSSHSKRGLCQTCRSKINNYSDKEQRVSQLEAQLNQVTITHQKAVQQNQNDIATLQKTIQRREATIAHQKSEITSLRQSSHDKDSKLRDYESTVSKLKMELKKSRASTKEYKSALTAKEVETLTNLSKIEALEAQQDQLLARVQALNSTLRSQDSQLRESEQQLKNYQKYDVLTTYVINKIIDDNDIVSRPRNDIKHQINFGDYRQCFNKHEDILKQWNVNSKKLENVQHQITENTYDSQRCEHRNAEIANQLYKKFVSVNMITSEQTKRLHKIGTSQHILQLFKAQNKLSTQIKDNAERSSTKENEMLKEDHAVTKEKRIELINIIENKVNECNNTIDKENDLLTRIKNRTHVLSILRAQSEQLQLSSAQCIEIITSYNQFEQDNLKYIESIKSYFDEKWMEFESKWWKWDAVDIISWFKYKTLGMDTQKVKWKKIKSEMLKRNINGKSLEDFSNLSLDMIGLQDFNIAVYLMKQIATLRTKYKYIYDESSDDGKEDATKKDDIPSKFICPLTKQIMKDPVIAFDENIYEREAIEAHLKENGSSPITGDKAYTMMVFANKQLKKEIEAYCIVNNIDTATVNTPNNTPNKVTPVQTPTKKVKDIEGDEGSGSDEGNIEDTNGNDNDNDNDNNEIDIFCVE